MIKRLNLYMEEYELTNNSIVYVELSFRKKDKVLLSEFSINKERLTHIPNNDIDSTKKVLNIPISIEPGSLGDPLEVEITNGLISNIKLIIDKNVIDILYLIKEKSSFIGKNHKDNITSFDSGYKFYLNRDEKKRFKYLSC
ncbi:MAG: hypothetical protein EOP34_04155 [Rickettsiales bacterium]|nr:MAG: hypothetical protein EOP34_04155 [Rickettsiales bacterium]